MLTEVYTKHLDMLPADVTFVVAANPTGEAEAEGEDAAAAAAGAGEGDGKKKKKKGGKRPSNDWIQTGPVCVGKDIERDFVVLGMKPKFWDVLKVWKSAQWTVVHYSGQEVPQILLCLQ